MDNEGKKNPNEELEVVEEDVLEEKNKQEVKENNSGENSTNLATNQENTNSNNNKSQKKKWYKYVIYLLLILVITFFVLFFQLTAKSDIPVSDGSNEMKPVYQTLPTIFNGIDWWFFALFCSFIVLGILLHAFILFLFTKLYTRHYRYHQAVANELVGVFYSDITPGSSGGQFAQAFTFKKQGIPTSTGASILVMDYIVHQMMLIICGLLSMVKIADIMAINTITLDFSSDSSSPINIPIVIFVIGGFLLNFLVLATILFMSYSRKLHGFVIKHVIGFLGKIHLVKNVDEKRASLTAQVANYRIELRRLQSNIPFTILICLLTLIRFYINGSIPCIVGYSLHAFSETEYTFVNFLQNSFSSFCYNNFYQMITGLVPIPGSAGISEFIFSKLYTVTTDSTPNANAYFNNPTFGNNGGLNGLLILWRLSTFYAPFLFSGIVAATYKSRGLKGEERIYDISSPRKTFLTIQIETYNERKDSSDEQYRTRVLEKNNFIKKSKNKIKSKKQGNKANNENKNNEKTIELDIGEKNKDK